MIIVATSDLHYSAGNAHLIRQMVSRALDTVGGKADVLLVLGDIGEGAPAFNACLQTLKPISDTRICVHGNHDLYANTGYNTDQLWKRILPEMASENGYKYGYQVVKVGNTVIVTNPCWHNLTWRSPLVQYSDDEVQLSYHRRMLDPRRMTTKFGELHRSDLAAFYSQVMQAEWFIEQPGDHLVVGTHWPIIRESYLPYVPVDQRTHVDINDEEQLRQFVSPTDAAFLSPEFGDFLIEKMFAMQMKPAMTHVVSGHTHFGRKIELERAGCPMRAMIVQSDYEDPGFTILECP